MQVPSGISHITWDFKLPPALAKAGVGKKQWNSFTHEVKHHARMSKSQLCTVFASGWAIGVVCDMFMWLIETVIGGVYCHKRQREKEHENFTAAHTSGALRLMAQRWDKNYFESLGLQVRLEPPDAVIYDSMKEMDVASRKSFKYQQKKGYSSPAAGEDSGKGNKKEIKYMSNEGRERLKAARKGRIIITPFVPDADGLAARMRKAWTMERHANHVDEGPSPSQLALPARGTSGC